MAMAQATTGKLTLLFDGNCGFCTRTVLWVQAKDTQGRIDVIPCQVAVRNGTHDVSEGDCGKSIWAFTAEGHVEGGAQAAALVASELMGRRWPVQVAKLPVIKQSLDLGYRFIANNRHRLPGIKGMCAIDGGSSCRS
ncbi:MAG TPA: DUF393 domain-containing protein [Thermomicrobiales bacterium]|nr:DUF393 domain-containing protein [Thermomicrobiales bacterium]